MKIPNPEKHALLYLMAGAFMISFSPVFVRGSHVAPTAAAVYRNLFGAIFLILLLPLFRIKPKLNLKPAMLAGLIGLIFAIDLTAWHKSIFYIGPGLSTLLGNFQVILLSAFGVIFLKEQVTNRFRIAVPLGLIGLAMIFGWHWESLGFQYKLGIVFGLLTAISYAVFTLTLQYSRRMTGSLDPITNLIVLSLTAAILTFIFCQFDGESLAIPDNLSLFNMIGYGVICQAIGWLVISRSLPFVKASLAGLILLLQPVLAFIWDMLFFSRPTSVIELFGVTLAVTAIYLGSQNKKPPQ